MVGWKKGKSEGSFVTTDYEEEKSYPNSALKLKQKSLKNPLSSS